MNSSISKPIFLILVSYLFAQISFAAESITAPILVEYNIPNASICEKAGLQVKFDHIGNFLFNNVFTVEIAANGDFSGQVLSLDGSRAQAGAAVNVTINATFPPGLLENTDYKIRVKGSNPLTYSPTNQFSFRIVKTAASPSEFFPEGYWRGSFFKWTPTTPLVISDGNTQDIFNPVNYLGHISEDSLSFDYNWGNGGLAPGSLPDSNFVCGAGLADFYSIRMRRRIVFEEGYYVFGGGGDDGFRLSLDGGLTWIVDLWSDHQMLGAVQNGGCGVFLSAGPKDVVADYYENKTDSRFQVIIKKTGDPSVTQLKILNPLEGAQICQSSAPFQMISNAPGGFQWSGPGTSASGVFNPQSAGLGFKTINYETGFSAFGSNCVRSTSVTIRVVAGVSAQFSGLDSVYCQNADTVKLLPENTGGTFFGPGTFGNTFIPNKLNGGIVKVGYSFGGGTGCGTDSVLRTVRIIEAPNASFQDLPDSIYPGEKNITLVPLVSGGTFSGEGVVSSNLQWIPSILSAGIYPISYKVTLNGCSASTTQTVKILNYAKPELVFPNLFTPNKDGFNDGWQVIGADPGMKVQLFDRWGTEVFSQTASTDVLWTGEGFTESGLYFYKVSMPDDSRFWTGWLMVQGEK